MSRGSEGRPSKNDVESHETFRRVHVSLPKAVCEKLDTFCDKTERARSWVIQKAVEEYLQKNSEI